MVPVAPMGVDSVAGKVATVSRFGKKPVGIADAGQDLATIANYHFTRLSENRQLCLQYFMKATPSIGGNSATRVGGDGATGHQFLD